MLLPPNYQCDDKMMNFSHVISLPVSALSVVTLVSFYQSLPSRLTRNSFYEKKKGVKKQDSMFSIFFKYVF